MTKRTVLNCDRCGVKDVQAYPVAAMVDCVMDVAGSIRMECHHEEKEI